MGLSNDVKSQMFNAIISINHPIQGNPTRCVCNNIHEFKKALRLKWHVWIIVHFVQINLAYFIAIMYSHNKTSLAYANFIKVLTCSNIGNTHGKHKIVSTSHKFIKLTFIVSANPLLGAILIIKGLYSFLTCFNSANVLIHIVFTFWKNYRYLFFHNFNKLLKFKMTFGGAKKYP